MPNDPIPHKHLDLLARIEALEARLEVRETSDDPLGPDPYLLREEIRELYEHVGGAGVLSNTTMKMRELFPWLMAKPPVEPEPDCSKCPECGGDADNGNDRCYPPNPYCCSKCDPPLFDSEGE